METGLVKTTTNTTAAHAAFPRPRGTVRAVGLFSSVTSRQAETGGGLFAFHSPSPVSARAGGSSGASTGIAPLYTSHLQASASFETQGLNRDSRRAEYLLVIYPGGELEEKLLGEQQQF